MIVEWSSAAIAEFEEIVAFLEEMSRTAATKFRDRIQAGTLLLARFPEAGRPSAREPGTRELVVDRYFIQYFVSSDRVLIAAIRHGARDREVPDPDEVHERESAYGSSAPTPPA